MAMPEATLQKYSGVSQALPPGLCLRLAIQGAHSTQHRNEGALSDTQVVSDYTFDLLESQLQIDTSFSIFFRAFGELKFGTEVFEVSTVHLEEALTAAGQHGGTFDAEGSIPQLLLSSLGSRLT